MTPHTPTGHYGPGQIHKLHQVCDQNLPAVNYWWSYNKYVTPWKTPGGSHFENRFQSTSCNSVVALCRTPPRQKAHQTSKDIREYLDSVVFTIPPGRRCSVSLLWVKCHNRIYTCCGCCFIMDVGCCELRLDVNICLWTWVMQRTSGDAAGSEIHKER